MLGPYLFFFSHNAFNLFKGKSYHFSQTEFCLKCLLILLSVETAVQDQHAHICSLVLLYTLCSPIIIVFVFHLSPLQKHVRKVVCGFGKKSCVSTGVRKPGNTYVSLTAMI